MAVPGPQQTSRVIVLFRIRDIEIGFTPSWLITVTLLALVFRSSIISPTISRVPAAGLSVGLALLFYVFVLLHEGAHTMVAHVFGLQPRRIVLFMLGGVSQIGRDAESPGQEYMVALAGPVVSLVLAGVLATVAHARHERVFSLDAGIWGTLAAINALLAMFNMIPGFPLDGGRVFRSTIWSITRNRIQATQMAIVAGRVVAAGLFAAGLVFLLFTARTSGNLGDGVIFLLLGWFLFSHSGYAGREEIEREMLREHARREAAERAAAIPLVPDIVPSPRRRVRKPASRVTPKAPKATLDDSTPARATAKSRARGAKQGAPQLPGKPAPAAAAARKSTTRKGRQADEGNASKSKADRRARRAKNGARPSSELADQSRNGAGDPAGGSADARRNAKRKR